MCCSLAADEHGKRISVAKTCRCIRRNGCRLAPRTNTNRACRCLHICRNSDAPPWMWWHPWWHADAPDGAAGRCTNVRHWCVWSDPMSWRLRAEFWPPWIESIARACTASRKCVDRRKCDWSDRHRTRWAHCSALVENTNASRRPVESNRSVCPRASFRRGRRDRCRPPTKSAAISRAVAMAAVHRSIRRRDQVSGALFSWRPDTVRRPALSPVLASFSVHCLGMSWAHYANGVSQTRSFCGGGGFKRFSRTKHKHTEWKNCEFYLFFLRRKNRIRFSSLFFFDRCWIARQTLLQANIFFPFFSLFFFFFKYIYLFIFTAEQTLWRQTRDRNVCTHARKTIESFQSQCAA